MKHLPGLIIAALSLVAMPLQAHAGIFDFGKSGEAAKAATKEKLVLMPLRVPIEDKNLLGTMETALVEGLQQKYVVFSGEQVAKKAHEIFMKESRNTAKKDCDETHCMQNIAEAFQAELIATANITKQGGGYFLALSIQNIFDNKVEYSKSMPCKGCDSFQVVEKLKELSGAPVQAPVTAALPLEKMEEAAQSKADQQDQQGWATAQQVNSAASYALYLKDYPKGRYTGLAKARIAKIKNGLASQEQNQVEKNTQQIAGCVFPGSSDPAPGWICDEPVKGYKYTTVGSASSVSNSPDNKLPQFQSALLDAIVRTAQQLETKPIRHTSAQKGVIKKYVTSANLGRNITVTSGDKREAASITITSKLVMAYPCAYTMKSYTEIEVTNGEGANKFGEKVSDEEGNQCTIKDVVKELSSTGLDVVDTVKNPQDGLLYLLLGSKKTLSELKIGLK